MLPVEGGPAADALPGASAAAAYDQFMVEHVQTWMPRFAKSTAEKARQPFFRAAAVLLGAYLR